MEKPEGQVKDTVCQTPGTKREGIDTDCILIEHNQTLTHVEMRYKPERALTLVLCTLI